VIVFTRSVARCTHPLRTPYRKYQRLTRVSELKGFINQSRNVYTQAKSCDCEMTTVGTGVWQFKSATQIRFTFRRSALIADVLIAGRLLGEAWLTEDIRFWIFLRSLAKSVISLVFLIHFVKYSVPRPSKNFSYHTLTRKCIMRDEYESYTSVDKISLLMGCWYDSCFHRSSNKWG
jgi:hypothetical protein